jgi:hypothetical protein
MSVLHSKHKVKIVLDAVDARDRGAPAVAGRLAIEKLWTQRSDAQPLRRRDESAVCLDALVVDRDSIAPALAGRLPHLRRKTYSICGTSISVFMEL